jgi:GNAT superfamily N-acetyltransferase
MKIFERGRDGFLVSTDSSKLDLEMIHGYLSAESYWAKGIPIETVARALANSLCFGVYEQAGETAGLRQVGLARVISDYATYGYLSDVFIRPEHQGHGLGKWLMSCIMAHPDLQGLRRWSLATRDAHGLYRQYGFTELKDPARWMEYLPPVPYRKT